MNYKTQDDLLFHEKSQIFSIDDVLMGRVKYKDIDKETVFYSRELEEKYQGINPNRLEKAANKMLESHSLRLSSVGDVRSEFPNPQLFPVLDLPKKYVGDFSPSPLFQDIVQVTHQMNKTSIAFVGKNGVGKTTLMHQFSTLYSNKLSIAEFNIDELLASKNPLDFLAKIKAFTDFLDKDNHYLFMIDHMSGLLANESNFILDSLKGFLREFNNVSFWLNLTPNEYRKLTINKEWQHFLTYIEVKEPSKEETFDLIKTSINRYKDFYNLNYQDDVIHYAINRADKYISNQNFPEKVFNVLDTASSDAVNLDQLALEKKNIDRSTSKISHVDINTIKNPVFALKNNLENNIIGQEDAVTKITRGVQAGLLGLRNQSRPLYSIFGYGSSGVGKTLIGKMISKYIMGNENNMLRIDMSQFENEMNSARLLGAPVGYKDFEKGGELTEFVKDHPHSVILLDEFEKASEKVQLLFLPILDEGKITDAKGDIVDFSNTIIIATSNAGIEQSTSVGFSSYSEKVSLTKEAAINKLSANIKKELLNRFDDVIQFNDLDTDSLKSIAEKTYEETLARFNTNGFSINVQDDVKQSIIEQATEVSKNGRQVALHTSKQLENIAVTQVLEGNNEL